MTNIAEGYKLPLPGTPVGTRAFYWQSPDGAFWSFYVMSCKPCTGGPAACHQLVSGLLPTDEPECFQFNARIATANNGWAFVGWHDTENDPQQPCPLIGPTGCLVAVRGATVTTSEPLNPNPAPHQTISIAHPPGWLTPFPAPDQPEMAYGDYDSAVGDPGDGSFYAAWGDLWEADLGFTAAGNTQVWVGRVVP